MDASLLHVVAVYSNPIRWQSRLAHFRRFIDHMAASGVKLLVVECAFGERPFDLPQDDARFTHVGVRARTLVWNKECLINLGLQRLPAAARYVAWIDGDLEFRNPAWAVETVHALQHYDVVQPWSEALDLGPRGEPMLIKGRHVQTSFCKVWRHDGEIRGEPYQYAHPGYAWAATREALDRLGGLLDIAALGAGDHHMAMSLVGLGAQSIHGQASAGYKAHVAAWAARAARFVAGNIGFVQGTVEHGFHGSKDKRRYVERWDVLVRHAFDPLTDLRRNTFGVLELASNKPGFARDIDGYFRQRDEDANILVG